MSAEVDADLSRFADADLIIASDGLNSKIRGTRTRGADDLVHHRQAGLSGFATGHWRDLAGDWGPYYPAMAVVQVTALMEEAALVEIETTAVVPSELA